jgi:hypothetical protein
VDERRAQASVAGVLPQLVDVHGHDRKALRRPRLLVWAVVHDQPKCRSALGDEGGELTYGRGKSAPMKHLNLDQHRSENTLRAGNECRCIDSGITT